VNHSTPPLPPALRRSLFGTLLALLSAIVVGCGNDELIERLDRLEAELREVRSDTRDEVAGLRTRVITAESTVGVTGGGPSLADRLSRLEGAMGEALSRQSGGANEVVYLRPNLQGHAPVATDHGIFLVRIEGIDLNLDSEAYDVHLNIGNPHALAIDQFSLVGDHGGGMPDLGEDGDYSLANPAIQEWQDTLKPFEASVAKTLEPFSWTPFTIELAADSREDLELIRFALVVENARLRREDSRDGSVSASHAHLNVAGGGASVLRTDYGAFLISVKGSESTDLGTRLSVEIGNPYGFTLDQCRLVGEFGPAPPKREESATPEEYAEKMRAWSGSLQPFEALLPDSIASFRWNRTSIIIPAPEDQVGFLRAQLRVEDVTLPAATDRRLPR